LSGWVETSMLWHRQIFICSMEESDAQSLFDGFTEAGDRSLR
jgi:hypothetical protein